MSLTDSRTTLAPALEPTSVSPTTSSRDASWSRASSGLGIQRPSTESTTRSPIRSASPTTYQTSVASTSLPISVTMTTSPRPTTMNSSFGSSGVGLSSSPRASSALPSGSGSGSQLSGLVSSSSSDSLMLATTTSSSVGGSLTGTTGSGVSSTLGRASKTLTALPSIFDVSSLGSTSSINPDSAITSDLSATISQPVPSPTTAAHNIIIDLGTCAGTGFPKVVNNRDGSTLRLLKQRDSQYSVSLDASGGNSQEFIAFLSDSGERCGEYGSCTILRLDVLDSGSIGIQVSRAGDRGLNMYPLSIWMDGGVLYNGTRADSQSTKYNCWGWPNTDCPFSFMYNRDPEWAISSAYPSSTIHITFCPPDGPAVSSIGQNPNPPSLDPLPHVTNIIIVTGTTIAVSTFWAPITSPAVLGGSLNPVSTSMDYDAWHSFCRTAIDRTCIQAQTFLPIEETTTVPIGPPVYATLLTTSSSVPGPATFTASPPDHGPTGMLTTFFNMGTTTTVPISTLTPMPTRPRGGSSLLVTTMPTTVTDSLGLPVATSSIRVAVIPTSSVITNGQGSIVSIALSDVVTSLPSPSPTTLPQTFFTLTSWTTHSIINGSTVPLVGGQVGVLTTVPVTYVLEPSTTVPIEVLSSISAESTRTSLPTADAREDQQDSSSKASRVAGAIVGSLVGFTLLGLLLYTVYSRRKRTRRASDYAAHRTPMWSSGSDTGLADGTGSRDRLDLDLNDEGQPRNMFVQPWVVPGVQAQGLESSTSRKMQREMEERGGALVGASAGPSGSGTGASSSVGHSHSGNRSSKPASRVPLELRPEPLVQWPVRTNTLSSIHSSAEAHPSPVAHVPVQPLPMPTAAQTQLPPTQPRHSSEDPRHNAIPPRYNEAWNTQR